MHIHNKINILLSTFSYMFRRLLSHLQGELYRTLKTTVTLNFMVAPCINNIKKFIVQLIHTIIKSLDY